MGDTVIRPMELRDLWRVGLDTDGEFEGFVGERNGAIAAWGGAFWKNGEPAFVTFTARSANVRGLMVGLMAKRLMKRLRERGVSEMFAYCDTRIEGVERWLEWLGFQPSVEEQPGLWRWEWRQS